MRKTKTFDTIEEASLFNISKNGEIKQKQNGRCQVIYYSQYQKRNPAKYKTVSFKSLPNAISFCNRIKKEGKQSNVNQEIKVKTINDNLHNVRFIFDKDYVSSKSYDSWNESNLNGEFAYNGVTDDF